MTTSKAECQDLMNAALPLAHQMLRENGEFFPYGAALTKDGEIVNMGAHDGREQPPSADVIRLLKQAFVMGAKSGDYQAAVLVCDTRVILPSTGEKSDAIAVYLDHRDDYSVVVLFPYQLSDGQLSFGEVFAQEGAADVFTH